MPAATISPDGSTASDANCTGEGDVIVRKLRYLQRTKQERGRDVHLMCVNEKLRQMSKCVGGFCLSNQLKWNSVNLDTPGPTTQCNVVCVSLCCCFPTHRTRSYARTVPSKLAETSACPLGRKATAVTGAAWSLKVTKQKPEDCWKILTCRGQGGGCKGTTALEAVGNTHLSQVNWVMSCDMRARGKGVSERCGRKNSYRRRWLCCYRTLTDVESSTYMQAHN